MGRIANLKIWVRLTAGIWLMLLVAWVGVIFWESKVNRETAIEQALEFSHSMHQATMAGLTGMMITGTVAQREVFLDQIKQLSIIRDLRVIRGPNVSKLFGPGTAKDSAAVDDVEQNALDTGKEYSAVQSDDKGEYLRVVRPAIALRNYLGKDCVACHQTPDGAVLGAVSMKISLDHVNQKVDSQRIKSLLAALLVSLPLLVFIYVFTRKVVTEPLEQLAVSLREIASGEGDLTRRLTTRSADEIGATADAFNGMMEKISRLVRHVGESASQVSSASHTLATNSGMVADSSARQDEKSRAASLAVERMLSSIESIAEGMERVHQQSRESLRRSEEGNQSVAKLIGAVGQVETTVNGIASAVEEFVRSTESITGMTRQVKDIAEQTNLLALNAAIEAARAGELGRGFAVVAAEVRELSQRSTAAAKEIRDLIGASVQAIDDGVRRVGETGSAIGAVAESVQTVAQLTGQISGAAADQARDIGEVNRAIAQVDEITRQNTDLVAESAIACAALTRRSATLVRAVQVFQLSGTR